MDQKLITSFIEIVGELLPEETSIAVADDHQFVYYQPSNKIDLKIRPGDLVKEGTLTFEALTQQQKVSHYIDHSPFGVSYYGMSIPILENGHPAGCITAILPSKPKKKHLPFITVKNEDYWVPIPYEKIFYLEAQNRKTLIKSEDISGYHKSTLYEFEWLLPDDQFIRCHRSYIVNIRYISKILPESHSTFLLVMTDQTRIPVSQRYASSFRKMLGF